MKIGDGPAVTKRLPLVTFGSLIGSILSMLENVSIYNVYHEVHFIYISLVSYGHSTVFLLCMVSPGLIVTLIERAVVPWIRNP